MNELILGKKGLVLILQRQSAAFIAHFLCNKDGDSSATKRGREKQDLSSSFDASGIRTVSSTGEVRHWLTSRCLSDWSAAFPVR